jgi:hypothetical protein
MLLKSPFRSPNKPFVTQEFGSVANLLWYLQNGINIPFHNGIDVCFGDAWQTLGTECINPFETAIVVKVTPKPLDPTSTKGNGVTIQGEYEGNLYQVVFWHTGEIVVELGQKIYKGDVVCYVGNSGLCKPERSILKPADGAHCHLMIFKYTKDTLGNWNLTNSDNGVGGARNARELFDFSRCEVGPDSGKLHDMWVIKEFLVGMPEWLLAKYFNYIKW